MCGIVGVASTVSQTSRSWLLMAREALQHRGPDDAGEWWSHDGRVGLAHRRLAIRDKSSLGRQPMHLRELGLSIVFNGEIYNFSELRHELLAVGYKFRSECDTEVLLTAYAHWGKDCLTRLNGMFAFAILDIPNQCVFLARDRAGEKPLFYRLSGTSFSFASELKALLANPTSPKKIDLEALDCYLAMGYVPGSRCILRGFNKLQPAHAMTFDLSSGVSKVWRYWQMPELAESANNADTVELLDEFEVLLDRAIGRQLVADVPVGILLSGGTDSSVITAIASRRASKVRTFSIGFPGHSNIDETKHARLIARHFCTDHTELMAEPVNLDILQVLACQFDEPVNDSSMIPTWLVSQLVSQKCSVALGGDGADELFGGYKSYRKQLILQQLFRFLPKGIGKGIAIAGEYGLPLGFPGKNFLQYLNIDFQNGLPTHSSHFDQSTRSHLMRGYSGYSTVAEKILYERMPNQTDLLQRATRMDFENYLAEDILVKIDRASMLNSLEVRSPFLDCEIIDFAFKKVPSCQKATANQKKILLQRLAKTILPPEFDSNRKQGFSIPLGKWIKSSQHRDIFWDTLSNQECMFDSKMIKYLLNGQDQGRNNSERIFSLTLLELWRRHYGISI